MRASWPSPMRAARAELYAKAAGVELGQVLRIAENAAEVRPSPEGGRVADAVRAGRGRHQTLEVEVHVTYALR